MKHIFLLLFVFAANLCLIVVFSYAFSNLEGQWVEKLEQLVSQHDGLFVSLGTLFLILALSLYTAWLTNRSVERREAEHRKTLARIKIAEFRQEWLSSIETHFAYVVAVGADTKRKEDEIKEANRRINTILLKMNPREELPRSIFDQMQQIVNADRKSKENEIDDLALKLINDMNLYLKGEWSRIKEDLEDCGISLRSSQ